VLDTPAYVRDAARRIIEETEQRLLRAQRCNAHLFNAHRQCQWCHRMQSDIDAETLARFIHDTPPETTDG
jgi:hypothetical protein